MCSKKITYSLLFAFFFFVNGFLCSQEVLQFNLFDKRIDFNITSDELLKLYPDISKQADENIKDIIRYSVEKKSESDFYFCFITFSFYKTKLFEINIQNNSENIINDEISILTSFFNKIGTVPNEIDEADIYNLTEVYRKDNYKMTLTEGHFTFCTLKDENIIKELKQKYSNYDF